MDKDELIAKIVLGEITGKNQAIHAYDKMIWTVSFAVLKKILRLKEVK